MKNLTLKSGLLISLLMAASFSLMAQWGARMPKSPEIHPDHSVTFRLLAKEASSVALTGNWMTGWGTMVELKNDTGLWSVTIDPLPTEMYTYAFVVNGVRALDPGNALVVRDGSRFESMFMVPGEKATRYSNNEVPHGTLEKVWYPSPTLGMDRLMYIYTPPGYHNGTGSLPVLYLLHGGGGDEDAWTTLGKAPQIMDNLIAAGLAKPMMVVMTNGNPGQTAAPGAGPVKPSVATQGPGAMGQGKFEESLVKDVIPFIEKNYRTLPGKANRAVTGLSMGGMQTMNLADKYPEIFSWYGVMSMGMTDRSRFGLKDDPEMQKKNLENLRASQPELYWIACGKDDFLFEAATTLRKFLDDNKFPYKYLETEGGHTWTNWRVYLTEFTQLIFK